MTSSNDTPESSSPNASQNASPELPPELSSKSPSEMPADTQPLSDSVELANALNAEDERRLHPLSWLYSILTGLQSFIIPFVFFWISANNDSDTQYLLDNFGSFGKFIVPIVVALFILMIATSVVKYLTYYFVIQSGEIRIRWGVFNKQVRHIPLNKIHNVSLKRNILHRLMGVAEVRLESAGSGQTSEAVMSVLSLSDALLLEEAIEQGAFKRTETNTTHSEQDMFHVKHNDFDNENNLNPSASHNDVTNQSSPHTINSQSQTAQNTPTTLLTLNNEDIVRYGLISNAGLALGGILTFIFNPEIVLRWLWQTLLPNPEVTMAWGILVWLGLGIVALLSFIVLAKVISIISAYVSLYQFSLQDNPQYVTIEKGLFTRNKSRMPLNKVQVWRIEETWLHRLFKRQRLLVDSAILKGTEDVERGINELVPLATPLEMQHLLQRWEQVDLTVFSFAPIHPKAWRRIWFSYMIKLSLLFLPMIAFAMAIGLFDTLIASFTTDLLNIPSAESGIWASLILPLLLTLIVWLIVMSLLIVPAKKRARFMGVSIGAMPDSKSRLDSNKHWLIWRDGWLTKKWIISEVAHCHGLQLNQSPFDRRYDMANLTVDTVGGTLLSARFNLLYLPVDKARQLQTLIQQQLR